MSKPFEQNSQSFAAILNSIVFSINVAKVEKRDDDAKVEKQ